MDGWSRRGLRAEVSTDDWIREVWVLVYRVLCGVCRVSVCRYVGMGLIVHCIVHRTIAVLDAHMRVQST